MVVSYGLGRKYVHAKLIFKIGFSAIFSEKYAKYGSERLFLGYRIHILDEILRNFTARNKKKDAIMLIYDLGSGAEAFSTNIDDPLDFEVTLPLHQAHGTRIVEVDRNGPQDDTYGADALITGERGVRIGVKTADCVPVLLYDPEIPAAAAVHSGWKGTVANISALTVKRMTEAYGARPRDIKAVIGPCIHMEAFEVGDELYDIFSAAGYADFCHRMPRYGTADGVKWHIDLPGICKAQLMECGLEDIETRGECTYTLHHRFYSARRLGRNFGKQRIISCIRLL